MSVVLGLWKLVMTGARACLANHAALDSPWLVLDGVVLDDVVSLEQQQCDMCSTLRVHLKLRVVSSDPGLFTIGYHLCDSIPETYFDFRAHPQSTVSASPQTCCKPYHVCW